MKKIMVLCAGNSCRSQIAEGYLKRYGPSRYQVYRAGIEAHGVNSLAAASIRRDQIDISEQTSDTVATYTGIAFNVILTVCDHANERYPFFPGNAARTDCNFPDPDRATLNLPAVEAEFDRVHDRIKIFFKTYIHELDRQQP